MSVTVTVRFPVSDVEKAIEGLDNNAAALKGISQRAQGIGAMHHRFVAGDDELLVIDEWESAEQFQSFFDSNPQIADIMTSIGMSGPPSVSVYRAINAAGTF